MSQDSASNTISNVKRKHWHQGPGLDFNFQLKMHILIILYFFKHFLLQSIPDMKENNMILGHAYD